LTTQLVLAVVALAQAAFLVLLAVFLVLRRRYDVRRRASFDTSSAALREPLAAWLSGSRPLSAFLEVLRRFPRGTQVGFASHLARTVIPAEQRDELAVVLRDEAWAKRALRAARSRWWTRRLEAARCLALMGTPADRGTLLGLLQDPVPAVAVAAVGALPRVADPAMIDALLIPYLRLAPIVRLYVNGVLRDLRSVVEPVLLARLVPAAPARELAPLVRLAAELDIPRVLASLEHLARHPDAEVRAEVARAVSRLPRESTFTLLIALLQDPEADVRVAAAHSLGELASAEAVPALTAVLRDPAWRVRFRAALALAALGEPGRAVLRAMRTDADRYAADMAVLITGLSDGALTEMIEA
jgi:HEAT repeat protein